MTGDSVASLVLEIWFSEIYSWRHEHRARTSKLAPPFITGTNGTSEEISTREALLQKVLAAAKKDLSIQRYKGLGEMNADQLWETTMKPENRVLKKITIKDSQLANSIFTILMGVDVEQRRHFLEEHSHEVSFLDI